ncbi:MAG: hypothetical protein LUE93_03730 [Bacteroides sp.]|nr:hypothetical protein [Bacteroides sp.]
MKRLFCWLILFSIILSLQGAGGKYNFSYLSLEDGLSQITVTAIHQDRQGYMWFGTRNGLNRYNGYQFEVFTHQPDDPFSISDNHILSITEDNAGNLWVGTNNGLNRLELSTYRFYRYYIHEEEGAFSGNMITSLFQGRDSVLWIGTDRGLSKYEGAVDRIFPVPLGEEVDQKAVHDILEHEETLYLATASAGVVVWEKD